MMARTLQARMRRFSLADTGHSDAELLVAGGRAYGVDLVSSTRPDAKPHARAGERFAAEHFTIDWERRRATCPEGRSSVSWTPAVDNRTNPVIRIEFPLAEPSASGMCIARLPSVGAESSHTRVLRWGG